MPALVVCYYIEAWNRTRRRWELMESKPGYQLALKAAHAYERVYPAASLRVVRVERDTVYETP